MRLSDFLKRIGADTRAKYVYFICAEGYSNTIDMATALHPQTQMTLKFADEILPRKYGFPMKIRMPTKLGFKNPEARRVAGRHQRRPRRLLGGPGLQLVQRAVAVSTSRMVPPRPEEHCDAMRPRRGMAPGSQIRVATHLKPLSRLAKPCPAR